MSELRLYAVRNDVFADLGDVVVHLLELQSAWGKAFGAAELWAYSGVGGRVSTPFRLDAEVGASLARVEIPSFGFPRNATHAVVLLDARRAGRRLGGITLAVGGERSGRCRAPSARRGVGRARGCGKDVGVLPARRRCWPHPPRASRDAGDEALRGCARRGGPRSARGSTSAPVVSAAAAGAARSKGR